MIDYITTTTSMTSTVFEEPMTIILPSPFNHFITTKDDYVEKLVPDELFEFD